MTTIVQHKRSETSGAIPGEGDIAVGELAINLADAALYTKRSDGSIIELGAAGGGETGSILDATEIDLGNLGASVLTYDFGSLDGDSLFVPIELASLSVIDSGGDGSLSYNNATGVFTYTGPSASDVRAHFSAGTGITITDGEVAVDTSSIATQSYVSTAISNLVDSSPSTLDTLNELAAALGDDANFSTTVSTALGNRLRIDVDNQSLTSTQKSNVLANIGITASVDEINYIDGVTSSVQTQLNAKANTSSLATVATSGSYNDLTNKPASGVTTGKAIAMAIVFGG